MALFYRFFLVTSIFYSSCARADLIFPPSEQARSLLNQYGVYLAGTFAVGLIVVIYMIIKKRQK